MADLTGKPVTELPSATALGDNDAFAISQSGASKKAFWSLIRSYFVRKSVRANDVYITENNTADQPIVIWQTSAATGEQNGLVIGKSYLGLYNADRSEWLWRTPIMGGSQNAWGVSQGGTGSTTPAEARGSLGLGEVGNLYADAVPSVSVTSSVRTTVLTANLDAGKWIILGTLSFDPNATGFRRAYFSIGAESSPSVAEQAQTMATAAANAFVQVSAIRNLTETTAVRLMAYHNAGTAVGVVGYIRAIQII